MPLPPLLYLSRADVEAAALDMTTIIALLEGAYVEKAAGRVEMPPKPGIHPASDAFIHAMPAYIPAMHAAGLKWVSGFPGNVAAGLPYVSGLIVLNDPDTGLPTCVMDCSWITAWRTGAKTALSAKLLARHDSTTLGVLGCGVQGRTNLLALAACFPLARVYAWDVNADVGTRYVQEMSAVTGIEIIPVDGPKSAVVHSDLVVTAGPIHKHPDPTIQADWLAEGAFASAVDFDSYWTPDALRALDHFSTDDHAQFAYYRSIGYFATSPDPASDLGELVARRHPGRVRANERTLAMNLGLAIDDLAIAPEVWRRAKALGIGTTLAL